MTEKPPCESESGHYWWCMCDAIYTSWFCGECMDKRRARLDCFRLSRTLLGFVWVWTLKGNALSGASQERWEAVASAAGATLKSPGRSAECSAADQTLFCLYFTFSLATTEQKKLRTSVSVDIWYGELKHARCVCGNCSSFTRFGKCFPDHPRRINGGRWVLVDSSVWYIDDSSLFWR